MFLQSIFHQTVFFLFTEHIQCVLPVNPRQEYAIIIFEIDKGQFTKLFARMCHGPLNESTNGIRTLWELHWLFLQFKSCTRQFAFHPNIPLTVMNFTILSLLTRVEVNRLFNLRMTTGWEENLSQTRAGEEWALPEFSRPRYVTWAATQQLDQVTG